MREALNGALPDNAGRTERMESNYGLLSFEDDVLTAARYGDSISYCSF